MVRGFLELSNIFSISGLDLRFSLVTTLKVAHGQDTRCSIDKCKRREICWQTLQLRKQILGCRGQ